MAVTYVLVARPNPLKPMDTPRFYARSKSSKVCDFKMIANEVQQSSTASKGDVQLVIDGLISAMIRHLSEGENVKLGDFGSFHMSVKNVSKVWNPESETWETAAPLERENFSAGRNVKGCKIVFTPGEALKAMSKTAKFQLIDGGTPLPTTPPEV